MKQKSAGMVMAIMLIAIFGWIAIVAFVIKPGLLVGAVLSLAGGVTIGVGLSYLLCRGWFSIPPIEEEQVYLYRKHQLGTRLVKNAETFRFASAGEDLKKGTLVESSLAGRVISGHPLPSQDLAALIYDDVKAVTKVEEPSTAILGWPLVDVKKGRFCWLQEPPLKFEKEKEGAKKLYEGKRIELIEMPEDPDPIKPGSKGVCEMVDGNGQLVMKWDSGRTLSLIPGVDRFRVIGG